MYCPECGTPNPESNDYCSRCGAVLEEQTGVNMSSAESLAKYAEAVKSVDYQKYAKDFTGFIVKYKKILIPIICAIVVICVAGKIAGTISSPERVAENYFESLVNSDYEKMFNYVMVTKSDFITKDKFVKYMENENPLQNRNILNYSIDEPRERGEMVSYCTVSYLLEGSVSENHMEIPLMKQAKKKLLFFDNYKVGLENILSTEFTVTAPEGVKVEIDGIEVPCTSTEEGYSFYTVDRFFSGKYTVKISGGLVEDFTEEIHMSSGGNYYARNLVLNQNTVTALQNKSQEALRIIFEGVTSGKSFSELQVPDWMSPEIANIYESVLGQYFHEDGTGLAGVSFADFRVEEAPAFDASGTANIYLKYKSSTVMKNKAWFSEEIETVTNEKDTNSTFRFVYTEGDWKLETISNLYIH